MKKLFCLSSLFALIFSASSAFAGYPERPVQLIVPFSPGSGVDLTARSLAMIMEKYLGKSMVVVNKDGGSGTIGTSYVAHSRPDGYNLLYTACGPVSIQILYGGTDYTTNDLSPVALITSAPIVLAVTTEAPFSDLAGFVAWAKANPNKLTVSNSAAGGAPQLTIDSFALKAGIGLKAMPMKGAAQSVPACVGGHVQAVVAHPAEVAPYVKSGSLKVIASAEEKRLPEFPDAPTFKEAGYDVIGSVWKGVFVPAKTPPEVQAKLRQVFAEANNDPNYRSAMEKMTERIDYRDSAGLKALWDAYMVEMEAAINARGLLGKNK